MNVCIPGRDGEQLDGRGVFNLTRQVFLFEKLQLSVQISGMTPGASQRQNDGLLIQPRRSL